MYNSPAKLAFICIYVKTLLICIHALESHICIIGFCISGPSSGRCANKQPEYFLKC